MGPSRRCREGGSVAPSRTAAIGGTRVALIAGRRLAIRVTTTPTTTLTMIVRVANTVSPFGNSSPIPTKSAFRAFAIASPRKRPTSEARSPTTSASSMTLPSTCRRELPMRAQGRELTHTLGDRDRERVRDHEGADEQGEDAEGEQELLEDSERLLHVVDALLRLSRGGLHLRGRRQQRADLAGELLRRHAVPCCDLDLIELVDLVEQLLRGRDVEDRDRRRADGRGVAVAWRCRRS